MLDIDSSSVMAPKTKPGPPSTWSPPCTKLTGLLNPPHHLDPSLFYRPIRTVRGGTLPAAPRPSSSLISVECQVHCQGWAENGACASALRPPRARLAGASKVLRNKPFCQSSDVNPPGSGRLADVVLHSLTCRPVGRCLHFQVRCYHQYPIRFQPVLFWILCFFGLCTISFLSSSTPTTKVTPNCFFKTVVKVDCGNPCT